MNKINARNKKIFAGLVIGAVALAFYGMGNIVSAFNNVQPPQLSVVAAENTQLAQDYSSGNPNCNPAGCAACSGCTSLQFTQYVNESALSGEQVSLVEQK